MLSVFILRGGSPPPECHPWGRRCLSSPCPLLFVYALLLQHVVLPFCKGNLFGCGQLCHTQNRRAPSVFDQSCLPADCSLALFGQSPDGSRRSVQQAVSPVVFAAGHGPPLPLAIALDMRMAGACMLPMPSRARALSEQLYCRLTHPFVMVPARTTMHLPLALQQVRVQTSC